MSHRNNRMSGLRPLRLQAEMLDACRAYILPSIDDPVVSTLDVSHVELSDDLCNVTFVLMPGPAGTQATPQEVKSALERVAPYARKLLGESVPMKRLPIVRMAYLPIRIERRD